MNLTDVNCRIYIGPYHLHFDWSSINAGAAFAPVATTTTGQVSGATSLVLASATGFGATTGVWVGPNGSGQSWEYERVTAGASTTKTVTRESTTDREHNGIHTSGAVVHQWYPVTTNDGNLVVNVDCDETVSAVTWTGTIGGVLAPQHVMRNGHIVVVTTNTDGAGYVVTLLGFVDSPTITDDMNGRAEWQLGIVSSAALAAQVNAQGINVGDNDLANAGSASSQQELVLAYDERPTGDFTAGAPDFSAASAIDDDMKTLWIAEHYTGTDIWFEGDNNDPENGYPIRFSQIYINPPLTAGAGARFIELAVTEGINFIGYAINSANGLAGTYIWIFKGPGDVEPRTRVFLVEDEEVFTRLNPLAESSAIYENRLFFESILPTAGELWLRFGALNFWQARVRWGTGRTIDHEDAPDRSWVGPTVTPPTTGQTMRYLHSHTTGTASTYWTTSMVRHAGYDIDDDDPIWHMTSLPGLGLTLSEDITATVPGVGAFLYINGPNEARSTDGLPTTGTGLIGDEQISWSAKTTEYVVVSVRGAGGTIAAIHNAGDEVYVMAGGLPTDAYLIKEVGWNRSGGTIYPKNFIVRTSALIDPPRNPDQDDYTADWQTGYAVTNNVASSWAQSLTNTRVKHVLFEIQSMTVDPARPRLNEVNAIVDPALHNPLLWLAAGTSGGTLIQQVLANAGIWAGAISHSGTAAITKTATGTDNAWTVIVDLAEYCGLLVTVGRDSKITITPNTFWTGTPTIAATWTRATAVSAQMSFRSVSPISQVILPWKTPDGATSGKIYYPAIPDRGTKLEMQETLYANSTAATAAARRLYFMRLYPFDTVVVAAGSVPGNWAGEAHGITWQFATDMQPVDRTCMVRSVEHRLEDGGWMSTFTLAQYGHESNF